MANVFISYATADRGFAAELAQSLERNGISVWWDRKITLGRQFDQVIEHELEQARAVITLWSQASVDSEWVKTETSVAAARGVLIPVRIDDCRLPLEFRRRQTADLPRDSVRDGDATFAALLDAVKNLLNNSDTLERSEPPPSAAPLMARDRFAMFRRWLVFKAKYLLLLVFLGTMAVGLLETYLPTRRSDLPAKPSDVTTVETGPVKPDEIVQPAPPAAVCKEFKNLSELGWGGGNKNDFCIARGYTSVTNIDGSRYKENGGGWCYSGDLDACKSRIRGGL